MAIGITKCVQLWDVQTKKMSVCCSTITIPGEHPRRGPRKLTRHVARMTTLEWSVDSKFLASGDASDTVYCCARGLEPPLQVGDVARRQKKILRSGKIAVSI